PVSSGQSRFRSRRSSRQPSLPSNAEGPSHAVSRTRLNHDGRGCLHTSHTECLKLSSAGTWAVTVGECAELGLSARPDEVTEGPCPDPAHAVIDFAALTNSKVEAHGARLARRANDRGRQHPLADWPEDD